MISQISKKLGKKENLVGCEINEVYKCQFCGSIMFQDGENVSTFLHDLLIFWSIIINQIKFNSFFMKYRQLIRIAIVMIN